MSSPVTESPIKNTLSWLLPVLNHFDAIAFPAMPHPWVSVSFHFPSISAILLAFLSSLIFFNLPTCLSNQFSYSHQVLNCDIHGAIDPLIQKLDNKECVSLSMFDPSPQVKLSSGTTINALVVHIKIKLLLHSCWNSLLLVSKVSQNQTFSPLSSCGGGGKSDIIAPSLSPPGQK